MYVLFLLGLFNYLGRCIFVVIWIDLVNSLLYLFDIVIEFNVLFEY